MSIPMFKGLTKREFTILENLLEEHTYLKDEVMFLQGSIGRALFIVEDGMVHIRVHKEGEEPKIIEVKRGEIFGEMALLEEMPRTADAVAGEKTRVYMLYKNVLEEIIIKHPAIGVRILQYLAQILSARFRATMDNK